MNLNLLKLAFSLALFGAATAARAQTDTDSSGGIASARNIGNFPSTHAPDPSANDFTNRVVIPTPEAYTNSQAAIAADQRSRARESGSPKGAAALEYGSRIEPRPPTAFLTPDPWVEQDHPWDFANSPEAMPPTRAQTQTLPRL